MKFFEVIRNATIVQRVMVVGTIFWIIVIVNDALRPGFSFQTKMLFPIAIVWGAYWIIIGIIEKRKNK